MGKMSGRFSAVSCQFNLERKMSSSPALDRRVVLTFMAHPDDAEILCGGTLIRLAEAGWEVHIATATAGDCGTTSETPWAIMHRRTEEAKRAAESIGGTYHCLGELDEFVIYDRPALTKCIELFRRVAPTLVFTAAPRDYMVDHEMASLLARSSSFIYPVPNVTVTPLVKGSRVPYLYYCDPVEGLDPLGKPVEPTTVIDVTNVMEKKAAMLACHESQREWLRAHHGLDEYIEAMRRFTAVRGKPLGLPAAEGFIQHCGHGYPHDDLLQTLFPLPKK
jgi:LmbE family N-acetylglucosaminyl deacetylase